MFNGLVKELSKKDIDCATVIHEIWNDNDSSIGGRMGCSDIPLPS